MSLPLLLTYVVFPITVGAIPLLIVVSGVLGGVILTVALIMIFIVCHGNLLCLKARKTVAKQHQFTNSPDEVKANVKKQKKHTVTSILGIPSTDSTTGSDKAPTTSSSSTTSSDGVSNNSTELMNKVEIRTSSSLSATAEEQDNNNCSWDQEYFGSGKVAKTATRPATDYVDGLPRPFEVSRAVLLQDLLMSNAFN